MLRDNFKVKVILQSRRKDEDFIVVRRENFHSGNLRNVTAPAYVEEIISSARECGLISIIITRSEIWEVSQWVFSSVRSRYTRPRVYLHVYDAYL